MRIRALRPTRTPALSLGPGGTWPGGPATPWPDSTRPSRSWMRTLPKPRTTCGTWRAYCLPGPRGPVAAWRALSATTPTRLSPGSACVDSGRVPRRGRRAAGPGGDGVGGGAVGHRRDVVQHRQARRRRALTSGSCGWGMSGSQKNTSTSMRPSTIGRRSAGHHPAARWPHASRTGPVRGPPAVRRSRSRANAISSSLRWSWAIRAILGCGIVSAWGRPIDSHATDGCPAGERAGVIADTRRH